MKKKHILLSAVLLQAWIAGAAQITFSGNRLPVLTEETPSSTGLNALYVVENCRGVSASYTATNPSQTRWLRYSNLGGGYAEEVDGVTRQGNVLTLPDIAGDMGYIIEDGTDRFYFWVTDYSRHHLEIHALSPAEEQDCGMVALDVQGDGSAINYYSINGRSMELGRDVKLSYNTLTFDEESQVYRTTPVTETLDHFTSVIHAPAPFCSTTFTLTGDRFLEAWGMGETIESETMAPHAVEAFTSARQEERDNPNETGASDGALGGSAPAVVEFFAAVTDAAVFTEWQFSTYPDFDDIQLRISDPVTTYTFREEGTTYVRFMCANSDGSCEYYGTTYEVSIGSSKLLCPNAFSPGASEGVNDEWKVSYSSIVDFECHIFNRLGIKMAELRDPSQGWDGKYKGKLVPAGVYYYVIKATGADGVKYNLSGDINIVNYK